MIANDIRTDTVTGLVGRETHLDSVSHAIGQLARDSGAATFGAHLVTCSDESEERMADAFQRDISRSLLPALRVGDHAPFRTACLGGRWEWGGLPVAEDHFAVEAPRGGFKTMVVKINSHVARVRDPERPWGEMERFGRPSGACGALAYALKGVSLPALDQISDAFNSEGTDRLALLREMDAHDRMLRAALVQARLQARHATLEIQQLTPKSPTLWFVVPCVTVNRADHDTEIIVGLLVADDRQGKGEAVWQGLGDDPRRYQIAQATGGVVITEEGKDFSPRRARDHRALVLAQATAKDPQRWRDRLHGPSVEAVEAVAKGLHRSGVADSRALLRVLALGLSEINPVFGAVYLFSSGAAAIHHVHRAHRLAQGIGSREEAERIIRDTEERLNALPEEDAHAALERMAHLLGETPDTGEKSA